MCLDARFLLRRDGKAWLSLLPHCLFSHTRTRAILPSCTHKPRHTHTRIPELNEKKTGEKKKEEQGQSDMNVKRACRDEGSISPYPNQSFHSIPSRSAGQGFLGCGVIGDGFDGET